MYALYINKIRVWIKWNAVVEMSKFKRPFVIEGQFSRTRARWLNFEPDELFYNHLPACVLFTALATLVEEYIQAANSPGAVPVVESAWNVFTKTKCTQTLNDAKALYE